MSKPSPILAKLSRIQEAMSQLQNAVIAKEPMTNELAVTVMEARAGLISIQSTLILAEDITENFLPVLEAARPLINNGLKLQEYANRMKSE